MSFIPEIKVGDDWDASLVRFATAGEAINYCIHFQKRSKGRDGPENRRAVESDEPVTHRWTLKGLVKKEKTP